MHFSWTWLASSDIDKMGLNGPLGMNNITDFKCVYSTICAFRNNMFHGNFIHIISAREKLTFFVSCKREIGIFRKQMVNFSNHSM